MKFIDMHCDTLMQAIKGDVLDLCEIQDSMLDIKRMKKGGASTEFFAIFFPPQKESGLIELEGKSFSDEEYFDLLYKCYKNTMSNCGDLIAQAMNAADIIKNESQGKMSGILTFEDGRMVDGSLNKMKKYYDMGIRLISLTWNGENCFGYPCSKDADAMSLGLKPFGKEAVEYMNELGILIDVSHLSDGGFWDVVEISKKPFTASHSNCRSLSPHQRNLTDEMIKKMAEKGGAAGINFAPAFLNADTAVRDSTLELLSLHLRKMIDVGGEDFPALGSDLDGITGNLEVGCISKMSMIFDRLKTDGVSERVIEKIAYANAFRVIKETLR
ncbi:MAG: dipeptidase [Defluviitaleaceae bacterium]|nr:dipeptidase [Defluviitaleaceae bacterium]